MIFFEKKIILYTDGDDLQVEEHLKVLAPPLQPTSVAQLCHIWYHFKHWSILSGVTVAIFEFPSRARDIDPCRGRSLGRWGSKN